MSSTGTPLSEAMETKLFRISLGCQSRPMPGRLADPLELHVHPLAGHGPPGVVAEHQVVPVHVVLAEPPLVRCLLLAQRSGRSAPPVACPGFRDEIDVDRARDYLALADAVLYALRPKPSS
jgi:hypothetical protein